jgi:hypothetical protein
MRRPMSETPPGTERDTIPPPDGAQDLYSAPTRVGQLPADVLAALRESSDDAAGARTKSGTRAALRLPPPSSAELAQARSLLQPEPHEEAPWSSAPLPLDQPPWSSAPLPLDQPPWSSTPLPLEQPPWSSTPPPLEQPPWSSTPLPLGQAPWSSAPPVLPHPPQRASLVHSLLVVAIFAALGGLVAAAITLW